MKLGVCKGLSVYVCVGVCENIGCVVVFQCARVCEGEGVCKVSGWVGVPSEGVLCQGLPHGGRGRHV